MEQSDTPGRGFVGSVRALGDGVLAGLQERIALVAVELDEETTRLLTLFVWICALVFAAMMALVLASIGLVYVFWESARVTVLIALSLFYFSVFGVLLIAFRRHLARQPRPFAATLQELDADRLCLRDET